jgi:tetratricopeptide (TPR) repeat protein
MPPKPPPRRPPPRAAAPRVLPVQTFMAHAVAKHQAGDLNAAIALYDQAIAAEPNFAPAHVNRGIALRARGRLDEALASYDRALALAPGNANALFNRGNALHAAGRLEEAVADFTRVVAAEPRHADAFVNRGKAQRDLGRSQDALASFDAAIALQPGLAAAHGLRGNILLAQWRLDDAVASYDAAIAAQPALAEAWSNRGVALARLKSWEASLASLRHAVALRPGYADAHLNLANVLQATRDMDAAIVSYGDALRLQPQNAEAHFNLAFALLLSGRWAQGLREFEWRWQHGKTGLKAPEFAQPLWLGDAPLPGKAILVHAEQGLGDTIQFARHAPALAAMGARVIAEVPRPLVGLMRSMPGDVEWVARGDALPAFDLHCPMLSLPLALGLDPSRIAPAGAYLHVEPQRMARWEAQLGPRSAPRVGLAWSGSGAYANDRDRSLALEVLAAHLPAGCEYFSLQNSVRESDREALETHLWIQHFGAQTDDFRDAAALTAHMDVVISVDTSLGHLAGALGKSTWLLLPHVPDWRWTLEGDTTPWYANTRLFRQDASREWAGVLDRVARELAALKN